jgi:hypothetical protein
VTKKKITLDYTEPDPKLLTDEDIRWAKIAKRSVDGLAAIAEAHAEACDKEWMGMQYLLEDLRETIDTIVQDFASRLDLRRTEGGQP